MVRVRLFAAARAVAGVESVDVVAGTIDDAISRWTDPVFARCTFLVNGVATTDRTRNLSDGDLLDVLPPFAGG